MLLIDEQTFGIVIYTNNYPVILKVKKINAYYMCVPVIQWIVRHIPNNYKRCMVIANISYIIMIHSTVYFEKYNGGKVNR